MPGYDSTIVTAKIQQASTGVLTFTVLLAGVTLMHTEANKNSSDPLAKQSAPETVSV